MSLKQLSNVGIPKLHHGVKPQVSNSWTMSDFKRDSPCAASNVSRARAISSNYGVAH